MAQDTVTPPSSGLHTRAVPLQAEELHVRLGGRDLGPFSFGVGDGELVCLLGGNGSGKTTAIRLVLGLVRPRTGAVLVHGREVSPTSPPIGVGYVPDRADFWTWETAAGNLRPFAAEEQIGPVLERVGLSQVGRTPVRRFSRGMRQRLSIARAIVAEPDLLVMDEPTIALDTGGVDLLVDLVAERGSTGRATLIATHDQGFLDRLAARVVRVENGRTT